MNQSTAGALQAPKNMQLFPHDLPALAFIGVVLAIVAIVWLGPEPTTMQPHAKPADCWYTMRHGDSPKSIAKYFGDPRLEQSVQDQAGQSVTIAGHKDNVVFEGQQVNVCP